MNEYSEEEYPLQECSYLIIGIGMSIHRTLGKGFLEIVYKDAFEHELKSKGINYEREKEYIVTYKDIVLPHSFYADFVIEDKLILEVKSKSGIIDEHYAQVLNFHDNSLQYKRVAPTK